ncbi:MAG: tetratricopeptide repeat protein [Bryobacteraceae bacterium]
MLLAILSRERFNKTRASRLLRLLPVLVLAVLARSQSLEQLIDANRLMEAREALKTLVSSSGVSPKTRLLEAMILYRERRYRESLIELQHLLGPKQRDASVYNLFGLNLVALKREADAEPFFRAAVQLAPDDVMSSYYLGMAELSLGRYSEAERLLRDVIRRDPHFVAGQTMLGLAMEQQGRQEAAIESYRAAIELALSRKEAAAQPRLYLARCLSWLSRFAETIAPLEAILATDPVNAEAHRLLGRALSELGHLERAAIHLRRTVELEPGNRQARYALGRVLQRMGRKREAEREFRALRRERKTVESKTP